MRIQCNISTRGVLFIIVMLFDGNKFLLSFSVFRFQAKEAVSGVSQVKSSIQRGIRTKLVEQFPPIDEYIAQIFPKKEPLFVVKW